MASPILPFAIGALTTRNKIADDQDRLTGEIVDTVAQNYFQQSSDEKNRLKKVDKVYDNLTNLYPVQAVEAFAHAGLITDDMKETLSIIQNTVKPEAIENLKNLKPEDLKFVFKNNNSAMVEATSSKENTVASNLNRGQLKNLSDLYFGKEIKEGKLDTARNLLFGGPVIKDKDVAPAILQLEKETDKIQPDLEKADDSILEAFSNIPGGPIITAASGSGTGISNSEFRLRQNTAAEVAMGALGLGGKYRTDANGDLQLVDYNEADGSLFNYAQSLIGNFFANNPNESAANFRTTGSTVADIVKGDLRQVNNSIVNYKKQVIAAQKTTKNLQIAPIKNKEIDEASYRFWVRNNMELLAKYAKGQSPYRNFVVQKYDKGLYQVWFDKYIEEAISTATGGSE